MKTVVQEIREERCRELEKLLRRALETLEPTLGRAEIDNRAIGATRFLVERSLLSVTKIREQIAAAASEVA